MNTDSLEVGDPVHHINYGYGVVRVVKRYNGGVTKVRVGIGSELKWCDPKKLEVEP